MSNFGCCVSHFSRGESVCPVCNTQQSEHDSELAHARSFTTQTADLSAVANELINRGALPRSEAGYHAAPARALSLRNPCRRQVFRLLGIYLPEREARELLKTVHDFKWIESEKAGFDVWSRQEEPLEIAARQWAEKYLSSYLGKPDSEIAA